MEKVVRSETDWKEKNVQLLAGESLDSRSSCCMVLGAQFWSPLGPSLVGTGLGFTIGLPLPVRARSVCSWGEPGRQGHDVLHG